MATDGTFIKALFDLNADPYETYVRACDLPLRRFHASHTVPTPPISPRPRPRHSFFPHAPPPQNLYSTGSYEIQTAKQALYALLDEVSKKGQRDDVRAYKAQLAANTVWTEAGGYIVPYLAADADFYSGKPFSTSYPSLCVPTTTVY